MTDTPLPYPHAILVTAPGERMLLVPATPEQPPDPPDPEPEPGDACATIEISGLSFPFRASEGEELDSYIDPAGDFVQRNIRCTHNELPDFVAWYRPDADSDREEWVFELGPAFATPQANMAAYTVTITCANGDTVELSADAGHYWFGRWRWQSAPRPVRRNYATLAAQHLIPHLDCTGLATGPILTVSDYVPMSTCGMPQNQGSTGGYPGLGILTGWQAQYLVRGAPETAWRAQAEGMNSYPVFVRDPDSYAPLDLVDVWPTANMYSSSEGQPYIAKGPSPCRTDQGHLPSALYVPWLLTGDPYYLEAMQFTANYQQLSLPSDSRCMVMGRYWAWPTRAIAELVASCPDSVPSWLLPRSYWQHWLDVHRGYIEDRASNASDPYYYVFHTLYECGQTTDLDPNKSGDHVWQQGMVDLVAAWIATWREEWTEAAEWCIHNSVARAVEESGWERSHCAPYHMRLQNASVLGKAMSKTDDTLTLQYAQVGFVRGDTITIDSEVMTLGQQTDDGGITWEVERPTPAEHAMSRAVYGRKCLSWAEAAELNTDTYGWTDTADNSHLSPETTDLTYPSYTRAALAQALTAGLDVPGLRDAYQWLDGEIRSWVASGLPVGDNWCVVPVATRRRRRHRRSDRTDVQVNGSLQDIIDAIRGED